MSQVSLYQTPDWLSPRRRRAPWLGFVLAAPVVIVEGLFDEDFPPRPDRGADSYSVVPAEAHGYRTRPPSCANER